jgi:hypothetical protein
MKHRRIRVGFEPQKATRSLISPATALSIFEAEGTVALIASRFRVSKTVVYDIKAGRAWGHVTGVDGRRERARTTYRYDDPVKGTLALYSAAGAKIVERRYRGVDNRHAILRELEASLGAERFGRTTVAFTPDLSEESVDAVFLHAPNPLTFGLKAQKIAAQLLAEKAAAGESPWEALKRQVLDQKADAEYANGSRNAPVRDFEAPSCHDLPSAVPSATPAGIGGILNTLEKVA